MSEDNDFEHSFGVDSGFTNEIEEKGWAQTFGPFMDAYTMMLRRTGFAQESVENHSLEVALIGASLYSLIDFALYSQSLSPKVHATTVDIRDLSRHIKDSSMSFIQADAQNMRNKIADSSFDVIFTHWLTHHLSDKRALTNELFRTLKNSGSIALIEMERDEGFLLNLEASGFVDIRAENVEGLSMEEYLRVINNDPKLSDWREGAHIRFQAVAISARKRRN